MKNNLIISLGLLCSLSATAQNDIDAMRYSQLTFGGTARFASMAGSMGALGGDISTLSFNPAGIAVFKKTELTISPSIFSQRTSSSYNGINSNDFKLNFNLGNAGLVATFRLKDDNSSGWESLHFGFGYNRTNNFHNRISIQGDNQKSSLLDTYVANATGHEDTDFDQFSTDLAWRTYLFNPDQSASGNYQYNHVIPNYGVRQKKSVTSKGSMGETVLSFGGSYKSKVLIGATVGFVNVKYIEESLYTEEDEKDTISYFKSFAFAQNLTTKGNGINFKMGVIVKPTDWLRLGAAIHTPTSITLKDNYSSSMKSDLDTGIHEMASPKGSFDYTITTPFRAIGSIGFVINKIGLLNVDYEFIDYSFAQLNSRPNVFTEVNTTIRKKYTATGNLRIGGEVRFDPIAFRLGYAMYGSPFSNGDNQNAIRSSYTGGVGYRQNNYFIDCAYVFTKYTEKNYLYNSSEATPVKNDFQNSSFMVTFGVRF